METQPSANYLWFAALAFWVWWSLRRRAHRRHEAGLLLANTALCIYFILAYYFSELVHLAGGALLPLGLISAAASFWHVWWEWRASMKAAKASRDQWKAFGIAVGELLLYGPAFSAGLTEGARWWGLV